jgi:hypothetical protein
VTVTVRGSAPTAAATTRTGRGSWVLARSAEAGDDESFPQATPQTASSAAVSTASA